MSYWWRSRASQTTKWTTGINILMIISPPLCVCLYRKQFTSCFEVAWLLSEAIQQRQESSLASLVSHSSSVAKPKTTRSSSRMKISSSHHEEDGHGSKRSLTGVRDAYVAWCALKTARQAHLARESFQRLTSQLHNPDLAKPIPEKLLVDLPDFALLDLCSSDTVLSSLLRSTEMMPVDLLVPSAQVTRAAGLTWFQVVSLTYSILTRCFWPADLPQHSTWSLHTHTLTPSLHSKYHSLVSFLQQHCPAFSTSCSLPSLPPSLLPNPMPPKNQDTDHDVGGGLTRSSLSPSSSAPLAHLRASDGEITVVWYRPPANSGQENISRSTAKTKMSASGDKELDTSPDGAGNREMDQEEAISGVPISSASESEALTTKKDDLAHREAMDASQDTVLGLFGFNQKAVKPPQPTATTTTPSVEVFPVRISSAALSRLREEWQELSTAAQGYLDGHVTGRPISRSPSRLRKQAEKTQRIHAGLQVHVCTCIYPLHTGHITHDCY